MQADDRDWKLPLTFMPCAEESVGVPCKSMVKSFSSVVVFQFNFRSLNQRTGILDSLGEGNGWKLGEFWRKESLGKCSRLHHPGRA